MTTNLIMHSQWKHRPADERFSTLADMYTALAGIALECGNAVIPTEQLKVVAMSEGADADLGLLSPSGKVGALTNWSASQLGAIAKAPMSYLRTLPADYAARDLNYSIQQQPRDAHKLYLRGKKDDPAADLTVRAVTSPGYTRIITANVVQRLIELQSQFPAWKAPMVYPHGDFGGDRAPCVGFAGDRDAYICLIDEEHRISDPTDPSGQGLARGIMVLNSDVGAKRLDVILFLCQYICGNFMIWGYKQIQSISLRHFGDKIKREWATGIGNVFVDYGRLSPREEEEKIRTAAYKQLAPSKNEIVDLLFKSFDIPKKTSADAYDLTERYGANPRSVWGMVQGLTRLSQVEPNMDRRVELDQAAAKIMDF